MKRTWARRALMVGASAAAFLLAGTSTAYAADMSLRYPSDRGYMHYTDDGDVFKVCDTRADGYGVTGKLYLVNFQEGMRYLLDSQDDGGDSGCDKFGENIFCYNPDNIQYQMQIRWHGSSNEYASSYFHEGC